MRKVLSIIFLIVFLSSCSPNDADNSEIPSSPGQSQPQISTGQSPAPTGNYFSDYFEPVNKLVINYPVYPGGTYNNLMNWQNYIQDKYGIELYVHYENTSDEGILYLNFMKGLTYLNSIRLQYYANESKAYELTPYYNKYEWGDYLESEYIDALKTSSGIYAIPAGTGKYIVPRYYNKEYIEKLGIPLPSTTGELYEFLKSAKKIKADDETFFPMCIESRALTKSTSDIFRAFGVFVDSELNTSITYDPNTGSYEDAVFSEDFDSPMLFLRQLQDESLLSIQGSRYVDKDGEEISLFNNDIHSLNKNFATEYYYVYDSVSGQFTYHVNAKTAYEPVNGYWLVETNETNVCEIRSNLAFYVFPKTIENINGTVDLFNDIFTDSAYYYDLKYGVEGVDYTLSGESVKINEPVTGAFVDLKQITESTDQLSNYVPDSIEVINSLPAGRGYEKNVFNMSIFHLSHSEENALDYTDNVPLEMLFSNKVSYRDAVEEYKNNFNKAGMSAIIGNLNERLGLVTRYDYN